MPSTEAASAQVPAELELADALSLAVALHRAGRLAEAGELYERILEVDPQQPDALNFLGIVLLHRGRIGDAIALLEKSIAIDPSRPDVYNNLGNVLLAAERVDDALAAYEKAIEIDGRHASALNNLGIIYKAQRRFEDAENAYRRALAIDPAHVEAYSNYGNLHSARGDIHKALQCFCKALTLRPHDSVARKHIALAYAWLGDLETAAKVYREWLAEEPDHPGVRHLLAACSGENVPERAADAYIEQTFDAFSRTFDSRLAILEYCAPQLVADALERAAVAPERRHQVLDVGCGTGLCGPLLVPYAAKLVGVDLSSGMLEKARARGVYDELVKSELTYYLSSCASAFDIIVSADTLIYLGVLEAAFGGAFGALRPGGILAFTLEAAEEADAPNGHRLNPHGRYSHAWGYVERTLRDAGYTGLEVRKAVLRQERGEPVAGFVVTARKPEGTR